MLEGFESNDSQEEIEVLGVSSNKLNLTEFLIKDLTSKLDELGNSQLEANVKNGKPYERSCKTH